MAFKILLVEDEPGLVLTLTDRLEGEGYTVDSAEDGDAGLEKASGGNYDLVILDIMLPKRSGLEVLRSLRQANLPTPVLMLTARGQVVDKVLGLQLGADDYLSKPFDMMELLARVEALLRRSAARPAAAASLASYQFGNVTIDFRSGEVRRKGDVVTLSAKEFQLLRHLIENRCVILTRDQLLSEVWGYDNVPNTRTVDVHMAWLRQKLEENPKYPEYLLTLRGLGYKFAD